MLDAIWVALYVREGFERAADKHLSVAGFSSLFPSRIREVTARGRRGKSVTDRIVEPLLPGYAIAAHDGSPDFWARLTAVEYPRSGRPVVQYPVKIAGSSTVPRVAVLDLIERSSDVIRVALPTIKAGDRARILADPFAGYTGEIGSVDGDRVELLVSLLGRTTRIVTTADKVEAAREAA